MGSKLSVISERRKPMIEKGKALYLKYEEIINYLIVGVLNTIVSLGAFYISVNTFLNPDNEFQMLIANTISWVIGVAFGYFANRKYVFKSKDPNIIKEGFNFAKARISTFILDVVFMWLFANVLGFNHNIMKLISAFLVTVANYLLSKLLIFKKADEQ